MDIKDIYNIDDIKKNLDGEELIMRKIYILKEAVSSEELVRDKYLTKFGINVLPILEINFVGSK